MKKSLVIFGLVFILIISFSVFVSASTLQYITNDVSCSSAGLFSFGILNGDIHNNQEVFIGSNSASTFVSGYITNAQNVLGSSSPSMCLGASSINLWSDEDADANACTGSGICRSFGALIGGYLYAGSDISSHRILIGAYSSSSESATSYGSSVICNLWDDSKESSSYDSCMSSNNFKKLSVSSGSCISSTYNYGSVSDNSGAGDCPIYTNSHCIADSWSGKNILVPGVYVMAMGIRTAAPYNANDHAEAHLFPAGNLSGSLSWQSPPYKNTNPFFVISNRLLSASEIRTNFPASEIENHFCEAADYDKHPTANVCCGNDANDSGLVNSGYYCNGSSWQILKTNGAACAGNYECSSTYCCNKICSSDKCASSSTCTDSDASDLTIKGDCTDATGTYSDECASNSSVKEFTCSGTTCISGSVTCPVATPACLNGICVASTTTTCTDSDVTADYPDGKNYYLKGNVSSSAAFIEDKCGTSPELLESICEGGIAKQISYICPSTYGCSNGGCVKGNSPWEQYTTCDTCTDKAYTWCTDSNTCISSTAGCTNKINHDEDCPKFQTCKPSLDAFASYKDNPNIANIITGIGYSQNIGKSCTVNFSFDKLNNLPAGYAFNLPNTKIISILNISSTDSLETVLAFKLNETEIDYPYNLTFYTWNGTTWEKLSRESPVRNEQDKTYNYLVKTLHFSLFLLTEPDFCGNVKFDSGYEECDGSVSGTKNCTSCLCDAGFKANATGFCEPNIEGETCSETGKENCVGYTLYTCNSSLIWKKNETLIGKCGVECLLGTSSCDGTLSLICGTNYKWINQGNISGLCGYYLPSTNLNLPTGDKCGNGICNYDENETSCPEDCTEEPPEGPNWLVIVLIVFGAILILILIVILFKVFSKRKKSFHEPNVPPLAGPGEPRAYPGYPRVHHPVAHHRAIASPAVHHAATGQPVHPGSAARYPVKHYPR